MTKSIDWIELIFINAQFNYCDQSIDKTEYSVYQIYRMYLIKLLLSNQLKEMY